MEAIEIIYCRGHPLVSASHLTTFEVTKEETLSENGHCIIGVGANKGAAGLLKNFKEILCHDDALLATTLTCEGVRVTVHSKGSASMALDHPTDFVWRKSDVCLRQDNWHPFRSRCSNTAPGTCLPPEGGMPDGCDDDR